jgi:hypothetical protein
VQLDLRDHLVGEAVGHHEARVAGGAAEVQQAALGQDHHDLPIFEGPLVVLRLDVGPLDALGLRQLPAMSISLSKWPMLPTIAPCPSSWVMCSAVMTS